MTVPKYIKENIETQSSHISYTSSLNNQFIKWCTKRKIDVNAPSFVDRYKYAISTGSIDEFIEYLENNKKQLSLF